MVCCILQCGLVWLKSKMILKFVVVLAFARRTLDEDAFGDQ